MRKEVRPTYDEHACAFCERSILKGERVDRWVDHGSETRVVCELCSPRATREGWVHESQRDVLPRASRRSEARPSWWSRLTGRERDGAAAAAREAEVWEPEPAPVEPAPSGRLAPLDADGEPPAGFEPEPAPAPTPAADEQAAEPGRRDGHDGDGAEPRTQRSRERPNRDGRSGGGLKDRLSGRSTRRETRHVRAVPANDDVKVERALELFNASEHVRTIAGITRSLGDPWVMAAPIATSPSEVAVVVAWELSWYRYRIDLGDGDQPVLLFEKGEEMAQLDESLRAWNAVAQPDGTLAVAAAAAETRA